MVRLTEIREELTRLLTVEGPIDQAKCRRLILRATSYLHDLEKAASYNDDLGMLVATVDLAEIIGSERQFPIDQIMDRLNEIEALSRLH